MGCHPCMQLFAEQRLKAWNIACSLFGVTEVTFIAVFLSNAVRKTNFRCCVNSFDVGRTNLKNSCPSNGILSPKPHAEVRCFFGNVSVVLPSTQVVFICTYAPEDLLFSRLPLEKSLAVSFSFGKNRAALAMIYVRPQKSAQFSFLPCRRMWPLFVRFSSLLQYRIASSQIEKLG